MRYFSGYDIGVLIMRSWVPKIPGHISCASSYDFPIYYYPVEDTDTSVIHNGDKSIIPRLIEAVNELEEIGCKAVVSSCGYFGHFQKDVAGKCNIPVYLSSICLLPVISQIIPSSAKIGIICYNKEKLTGSLFESCGVSEETVKNCVICDVIGEKELGKIIKDQGHYNIAEAKSEVVSAAKKMKKDNPDIEAILLECTDLPPHAADIQSAVNLPVFDVITMINYIHGLMSF